MIRLSFNSVSPTKFTNVIISDRNWIRIQEENMLIHKKIVDTATRIGCLLL